MRVNNMKKILSFLLILSVVFSFAACSDKKAAEETTAAPVAESTTEKAPQTKPAVIAGKSIMLKSADSRDFVEIMTDSENKGANVMIYKFYDTDAEYEAAKAKKNESEYTFVGEIDANRQLIFSDSEVVKGMTYDEILAAAEKAEGYIIVPAAE